MLVNHCPLKLHEDNLSSIVSAMDIPDTTSETVFSVETRSKILKHQSIKIVPNTVAVAYYRGTVSAIAAVDTVLYLHALGGRYETRSLRPHRVEHIVVNGVNQRCALTVRAGAAYCGPIWCAPKRRDALLSDSTYTAIRGGAKWCTPIDAYGKFRCAACNEAFTRERDLFKHGNIPSTQHEVFTNPRFLIPKGWRPLPPQVKVAPVSHTNFAEGTLGDRMRSSSHTKFTYGEHRTAALKARLSQLERRHGNRYIPYTLRRVYK